MRFGVMNAHIKWMVYLGRVRECEWKFNWNLKRVRLFQCLRRILVFDEIIDILLINEKEDLQWISLGASCLSHGLSGKWYEEGLFHPSVRDKTENQMQFPQSIDAFVISDLGNKLKCRLSFIREEDKLIHENCFGFQRQCRCQSGRK